MSCAGSLSAHPQTFAVDDGPVAGPALGTIGRRGDRGTGSSRWRLRREWAGDGEGRQSLVISTFQDHLSTGLWVTERARSASTSDHGAPLYLNVNHAIS